MERIKIAPGYCEAYLEIDRPQPLTDNTIEQLIKDLLPHEWGHNFGANVYTEFKTEMACWLSGSKNNCITGLNSFDRVDIINGCTQYIDNLYMQGAVQTLQGDYRYHARLNPNIEYSVTGQLHKNVPLVLAMPFPSTGAVHNQMEAILDEAQDKGIDVHVDGAWLTCCRGINFDLSHPSIKSVAISLSKGLGLGWNRIGLRWTRQIDPDSVTIMNDFNMNLRAPAMIGLHFIRNLSPDYLWNTHGDNYHKVCHDFVLTPTRSIYLALKNGQPVGVSPLLRYLENESS